MATTWNPSDKGAAVTLSGGNLSASVTGASSDGVRATTSKASGKYYFELSVPATSSVSNEAIGLADATWAVTSISLGQDTHGICYRPDGAIKYNAATLTTAAAWANGDLIAVAFEPGVGVKFYRNNVLVWTETTNYPSGTLYAAYGGDGAGTARTDTVNFGATSFTYTPPSGYIAYDGAPTGTSACTLPFVSASGTATSGNQSTVTIPSIVASGTGIGQGVGTSSRTLPSIVPTGVGFSVSGALGAATLPSIVAAGTAISGAAATSSQTLPFITAAGTVPVQAASGTTIPSVVASSVAISGALGTSVNATPTIIASGLGGTLAVGTSVLTLPAILAVGIGTRGTGATFSAVVMNTETQALWTYSNFAFNSFAKVHGQQFAAGDGGLYTLGGATDDGTQIQAAARSGVSDFGSAHIKRLERAYMGYSSAGNMTLRVITDGVTTRDYLVRVGASGIHGRHVKLGRGLEARYWQFEWRNQAGADFSLNMFEVKPLILGRRVSGNDA